MKAAFLMIVLMTMEDGGMSAAFVNTATLEECEARARIVQTILEDQNVAVEHVACRASDVQFEPFTHGTEANAERYGYVVSFDERDAWVAPQGAGEGCEEDEASGVARVCATSTQRLLP